jgi:hypothetical protein
VGLNDETNISLPAKVKPVEMKIKIQQIKGNNRLFTKIDGKSLQFPTPGAFVTLPLALLISLAN